MMLIKLKNLPLIQYVNSIVDDPKETATVTSTKKSAVNAYSKDIKYDHVCNSDLKKILETAR